MIPYFLPCITFIVFGFNQCCKRSSDRIFIDIKSGYMLIQLLVQTLVVFFKTSDSVLSKSDQEDPFPVDSFSSMA